MAHARGPVGEASPLHDTASEEWWREAFTMAFYVAVCLLAALVALDERTGAPVLGLVWGTTIGLALAHLFAFRLAARMVGGGEVGGHAAPLALVQLAGAAAVAVVATVPVVAVSPAAESDAARWAVAAVVSVPAYLVARAGGARPLRSAAFAGVVLAVAVTVAVVKNVLLGH